VTIRKPSALVVARVCTTGYSMGIGGETSTATPVMLLFEIHYLPTKRSRKVRVAGIYADSGVQARRYLRQKFSLRMLDYKVISCEAIA
jgi:hypothetical protein